MVRFRDRDGMAKRKFAAAMLLTAVAAWPASAQLKSDLNVALPSLQTDEKDPNAIYCRPPQPQSDSRLPGPKTCKTNRTWDELHAQGLDIGADGKSVVASEKYRNVHGL
jgi:hypothetical protein